MRRALSSREVLETRALTEQKIVGKDVEELGKTYIFYFNRSLFADLFVIRFLLGWT